MPGKTDSLYDLPQNEVAKLVTDQWFEYLSFMGSSPRARLEREARLHADDDRGYPTES